MAHGVYLISTCSSYPLLQPLSLATSRYSASAEYLQVMTGRRSHERPIVRYLRTSGARFHFYCAM